MQQAISLIQIARAVLFGGRLSPDEAAELAEARLAWPLSLPSQAGESHVGVVPAPEMADAIDDLQPLGEVLEGLRWTPDPSDFHNRTHRFVNCLVMGRSPDGSDRLGVLLSVTVGRGSEDRLSYRMLADVRWDPDPASLEIEVVLALVKRRRERREEHLRAHEAA